MKKITNRRSGHDRRQIDLGPPAGWSERRRSPERRMPAISEDSISEEEWLRYFGQQPGATPTPPMHGGEIAAQPRDKTRG